ncbi:MAG TPA: hypothetical protein VN914_15065 [Polyangia bacterium]|nr:hypothetical protein [Polyangia bacterium]
MTELRLARRWIPLLALLACASRGAAPPSAAAPAKAPAALVVTPDQSQRPKSDRPWGDPVQSDEADRKVMAALGAAGKGTAPDGAFSAALVIGPALWSLLTHADPALGAVGTPAQAKIPLPDGSMQTLEMRTFVNAGELPALLRAAAFQKVTAAFARGHARAASEAERKLFYVFIPFEIAGQPLTIVEQGRQHLVAHLSDGKVAWLDVLSAYSVGD